MPVDRSIIRVKAMLLAPDGAGTSHAVSVNPPTAENPTGYHRLIGGGVELGETARERCCERSGRSSAPTCSS